MESGGAIDVNDSGSMRREVMAILPLLEKVTRTPDQVASADVDAVRVAGVPDEGIVDALHVNLIFNIMNRLANAFDFSWDSEEHVRVGAKVIHRISYRPPRSSWPAVHSLEPLSSVPTSSVPRQAAMRRFAVLPRGGRISEPGTRLPPTAVIERQLERRSLDPAPEPAAQCSHSARLVYAERAHRR